MFGLRKSHLVCSNRESGFGRHDRALLPRKVGGLGFIMKLKRVLEPRQLIAAAGPALPHIDERGHEAELRQYGVERVTRIGMAFSGKRVTIRSAPPLH
jgi:PD-(D/E)XK nuclease superfamily